jgi:iron complex outermembrane receptor protein
MKNTIIALLLGFSAMLQAQNSVSGKVTDKDMNPIVGVSVYAPELHKGTTTDVDGIIRSQIFLLVL